MRKRLEQIKYFLDANSFRAAVVAAVVVVAAGAGFTVWQWDWLHGSSTETTASTTLRNMGLLIAGGLAIVFAAWRGWVAERQSATAQRQADIADQNLLNERYQRGAEMLGNPVLSVRMAGIYALQRLAEEHPKRYHIQIMRLFCAFVRNPAGDQESPVESFPGIKPTPRLREDIQAVVDAIGSRSKEGIELEGKAESFRLDFRKADLRGASLDSHNLSGASLLDADLSWASLNGADLRRVILTGAKMCETYFQHADLSHGLLDFTNMTESFFADANLYKANLFSSDLSRTDFRNANLYGAFLAESKFHGTVFTNANLASSDFSITETCITSEPDKHGLTQRQLDEAICEGGESPDLRNLHDSETHDPLFWRDRQSEF